jgi:hypothetical protein
MARANTDPTTTHYDIYDAAGRLVKVGVSLDEATETLRLDPTE